MTTLVAEKEIFLKKVAPFEPNEWDVGEAFEALESIDPYLRQTLLDQVDAIWPVSQSLCFSFLIDGSRVGGLIPADLVSEWVRNLLQVYEERGLLAARECLGDVEAHFLGPLRGQTGVRLDEVRGVLSSYISGVAGKSLQLEADIFSHTDGRTIFLPSQLDLFADRASNQQLYKLLVSVQWGSCAARLYKWCAGEKGTPKLINGYKDKTLAGDLFAITHLGVVLAWLNESLPGLAARLYSWRETILAEVNVTGKQQCYSIRDCLAEALDNCGSATTSSIRTGLADRLIHCRSTTSWGQFSAESDRWLQDHYGTEVRLWYERLAGQEEGRKSNYQLGRAAWLIGSFDFTQGAEVVRIEREEQSRHLVQLLAPMARSMADESEAADASFEIFRQEKQEIGGGGESGARLPSEENEHQRPPSLYLKLGNELAKLSAEVAQLVSEIEQDLGAIPQGYVQALEGVSGGGMNRDVCSADSAQDQGALGGNYDEWDFRRNGYRKNWCTVREKPLSPVRSSFVDTTLEKYRPVLNRLRRQFEMLRTSHRFSRGQREGDELDLDALIDSLGDQKAGITPSDRLFIRLLRTQRDIGALFLVDMSNSTEGWVGTAVKEALVLLAEALEVVGDRYGIYGFSGMRRSKCDLFVIKKPDEPYSEMVQHRISGITPQDYTRMGPPIRHLTRLLMKMEHKTRLLIVLSDGKPEDYDDYKGQYAIEDTRRALLEARGVGIHPFCITIDKAAQDYLGHMFGQKNYIFIDRVAALPGRMADMYRRLTI